MNNLYNKIYEAVDTGIQKALILDPENDVSVNWQNKKITTEINEMNKNAENFLNAVNIEEITEYYNLIMNDNRNFRRTYMAKNIYELTKIYQQLKKIKKWSIPWVNSMYALSIITNTGKELHINQYLKNKNCGKAEFLKIMHESGSFLIHTSLMISDCIRYCNNDNIPHTKIYNYLESQAANDFKGFENTYSNKIDKNKLKDFPVFKEIHNIKVPGYKAYLPALGELKVLFENIDTINHILYLIDKKENTSQLYDLASTFKIDLNDCDVWSSTEKSVDYCWTIQYYIPFGSDNYIKVKDVLKTNQWSMKYIPFFKKI